MVPHDLRHHFGAHKAVTAAYRGWSALTNGALLAAAEREFEILVTLDTNMQHQQHVTRYALAIVVLSTHPATVENLVPLVERVVPELERMDSGRVYVIGGGNSDD